jgi:tryptophan synthase beta chain
LRGARDHKLSYFDAQLWACAKLNQIPEIFSEDFQDGQILEGHSISAGLDYPGVGPEHGILFETGRVTYAAVNDEEAVQAFQLLSQQEGIIPALESSHAIAYAIKLAKEMQPEQTMIVNLSGRGDKDLDTVKKYLAGATA